MPHRESSEVVKAEIHFGNQKLSTVISIYFQKDVASLGHSHSACMVQLPWKILTNPKESKHFVNLIEGRTHSNPCTIHATFLYF